jgi:hypothetical protein
MSVDFLLISSPFPEWAVREWATEHVSSALRTAFETDDRSELGQQVAAWRASRRVTANTITLYRGLTYPLDLGRVAPITSWTPSIEEARLWGRHIWTREAPLEHVAAHFLIHGIEEFVVWIPQS